MLAFQAKREREVHIHGTRYFPFTSTSGQTLEVIDLANGTNEYNKYAPFQYVDVVNNEVAGTDVTVYINGDTSNSVFIPAGTIRTIGGQRNIHTLRIVYAVANTGKVEFRCWNERYDDDQRAFDSVKRHPVMQLIEHLTGVRI